MFTTLPTMRKHKAEIAFWEIGLLGLALLLTMPVGVWAVEGDLDGDGKADIVWRNMADGAVAVWLGNGATAPTTIAVIGRAPSQWSIVGLGDLDGDGKADIVWRNIADGAVAVWRGNGATAPTTMAVIGGAPSQWSIVGLGDLDGDGKADIVWRNMSQAQS